MTLKDIRNNDHLIASLREQMAAGRVPHAMLIEAPRTVDKSGFALALTQALLCPHEPTVGCGICSVCRRIHLGTHLDVTRIHATAAKGSSRESVKDADVENVLSRLGKKPLEGDRNVAIVEDADTMSAKALNHFLKTLEEPAPGTVILLLSENADKMPATIRSRCVQLRLLPFGSEAVNPAIADAKTLTDLVSEGDNYFEIKNLLTPYGRERGKAQQLIDAVEQELGEALKTPRDLTQRARLYRGIGACEKARGEVERGLSATRALKKMAMTMGEHI